jgi:hypothetical protein
MTNQTRYVPDTHEREIESLEKEFNQAFEEFLDSKDASMCENYPMTQKEIVESFYV